MHIVAGAVVLSSPQFCSPSDLYYRSTFEVNSHLFLRPKAHSLRIITSKVDTRTHLENLTRLVTQPRQEVSPHGLVLPSLRIPSIRLPLPAAEENASPRSLAHLRYLLSDSAQEPSPRRPISQNWRELQGCAKWSGLLNPLDPDLRRELLRYGDFVHSAYHAFFNSPLSATYEPRPITLLDRSFRLTRHLYATASIRPPRWLPSCTSHSSSWIGFVAVCDNDREIRRMGRRDIVITLRGTSTFLEWAENLRANLVPLDSSHSKIECGFSSLYTTPGARVPSLSTAISSEIRRLVELYQGEELSITVTGHSLGAALAVLIADDLSNNHLNKSKCRPPITVISFGGPRVGNRAFTERVEKEGVKVLRVVNAQDLVTKIPTAITGCWHWWDGYEHVGEELKVDSRLSPFLKPDADPACCHDLEAYLHLVDGLGGSDGIPFRATAKRSMVRLLSNQRGNVKKLYVRKARALGVIDQTEDQRVHAFLC